MIRKKSPVFIPILIVLSTVLLAACGEAVPVATPTPTLLPGEVSGELVFSQNCAACHLLSPDDVKVGPSLHGIADRAATRVEGQDAHTYILTSILRPDDYLVEGYDNLMPLGLAKSLTSEEMDAVIEYLLTLESE
ncbi:MAG: c-type cytochrome [Chloroflexota bacterium]